MSSDDCVFSNPPLTSKADPCHRATVRSIRTSSEDGVTRRTHCFPKGLERPYVTVNMRSHRDPTGLDLSASLQGLRVLLSSRTRPTVHDSHSSLVSSTSCADPGHRATVRRLFLSHADCHLTAATVQRLPISTSDRRLAGSRRKEHLWHPPLMRTVLPSQRPYRGSKKKDTHRTHQDQRAWRAT